MEAWVTPLIAWHKEHRIAMPWRENQDAYRVWISEIMLQQTRIEAVIPYYERFMRELPDVAALAQVEEDRLLKLWEGLGYYSRARNLKKAAITVMEKHGGTLPADAAALRALSGIGDYTAGAIASIAYGLPEPAVDGNVLRVLARLYADPSDILLQKTKKAAIARLRALYPSGEDARLLTEGLMELGETVCIPNGRPRCENCPIREHCAAHASDAVEQYPVRAAKKERRIEERTVYLMHNNGQYAIERRGAGLLSGMWQFPNELGHPSVNGEYLGKAKHIFSHVEWHMIGYRVESERNEKYVWADAQTIREQYAIPKAFRAFMEKLI